MDQQKTMAPVEARLCFLTERASQGLLEDGRMIEFLISALGVSMLQYLPDFFIVVANTASLYLVRLPFCAKRSCVLRKAKHWQENNTTKHLLNLTPFPESLSSCPFSDPPGLATTKQA